jgi:ABC-type sugar transport system substrate-binding protein
MSSLIVSRRSRGRVVRGCAAALATAGCLAVAASSAAAAGGAAAASGLAAAKAQLKGYVAKPTSIGTFPALKSAPPKGKTVVYLGTSEVSNTQVAAAVKQVAALAHWKYFLVSYDPANPATFLSAFNTAIAKHANYVLSTGTPLPPQVLTEARAHHIKIALDATYPATLNSTVIDSSDGYTQDHLMGELVADEFIVDSKGAGKAVEEAVPQYPILTAFSAGFKSTVSKDCPKCSVVMANVTIPQLAAGQLNSVVVSAVKSHPGYNYLVTDDGPFFDGIQSALSAAGISGEKILGEAGDQTGFTALKAGTELAWTGYSVPFPAWEMMDAVFRNAEGVKVPAADATQPTQLATHATAGSIKLYPSLGGWNYPTNGLQQFEAIWHIK